MNNGSGFESGDETGSESSSEDMTGGSGWGSGRATESGDESASASDEETSESILPKFHRFVETFVSCLKAQHKCHLFLLICQMLYL